MGSYNNVCMISGVKIKNNEKVRLFFLSPSINYKSEYGIFSNNLIHSWSAFNVISGLSVEATFKYNERFDVVNDSRSDIVLHYLRSMFGIRGLSYEQLFDMMKKDEALIPSYDRNIRISIGVVCDDVYKNVEKLSIERFGKYIDKDFERSKRRLNDILNNYDINDSLIRDLFEPEIGYLQQYMSGHKNPYHTVLKKINKNYSFDHFKNDFRPDILVVEAMEEAGIIFSPTMLLNEDVSMSVRSEILKLSLEKSLNTHNYDEEEYLSVENKVKIIKKIKISEIERYMNEFYDRSSDKYHDFLTFKDQHKKMDYLRLEKDDISKHKFLQDSLSFEDEGKDLWIIFS